MAWTFGCGIPTWAKTTRTPLFWRRRRRSGRRIVAAIPYLDHMMIPAGDPGELTPQEFSCPVVTEHGQDPSQVHLPNAKIWIAPQSLRAGTRLGWRPSTRRWRRSLTGCTASASPPWEKDTLEELREHLPPVYRDRIPALPGHHPQHRAASLRCPSGTGPSR